MTQNQAVQRFNRSKVQGSGKLPCFENARNVEIQQHKRVAAILDLEYRAGDKSCVRGIGDFYMSWNRGNTAWIGEINVLGIFLILPQRAHIRSVPNAG